MRLLRHLSFSNVIATLALFLALGGAAYAGTKINGGSIKNGSIGGGKLKNETITANKIKKGTITGTQIAPGSISSSSIDVSTLGTVPSAQNATAAGTATKADSATTAGTATTANSAKTAESADNAKHAESADHADSADTAAHADVADRVTNADTASRADIAGEAEALNGETAEELTLSCKTGTKFYGGMCWDQTTQPARLWIVAVAECGKAGGRLPTIEELIAFVLQDGEQVEHQTWSADVDSLDVGKKEVVFTTDESGRSTEDSGLANPLGYRCVFPESNSVD
jgi:hypothetical protein